MRFHEHPMPPHAKFATLMIRLGLGVTFFWFGVDKLIHPEIWLRWIPALVKELIPISNANFIYLDGAAETIIGILLLLGKFTRTAALAAAIILSLILILIGPNDFTVRDIGLLGAALSLFITGANFLSLDKSGNK